MKICLMNDSFPPVIDGVANAVMNYADVLTRVSRDDVTVATPRYPDTDYTAFPYRVLAYPSLNTAEGTGGYRAGNPLSVRELRELAQWEPDLIHVHSPVSSAIMGRILRGYTGSPIVYTYHTKYDEDIARVVHGELLQKESIRAIVANISACDEVWVVSRGAGENLDRLGFQGTWRVVENGVDLPRGRASQEAVEAVRDRLFAGTGAAGTGTAGAGTAAARGAGKADVPVLLYVGRIVDYKGLPLIVDALARLAQAGRDFRMVFIGKGPDAESLKKRAQAAGLTDETGLHGRCVFPGPVYDREQLRAWYTLADLFVFPSTFDTNGLVVREAAACGLASVLIEGSCAAEGVTDGRNGFLIREDAASLAAFLEKALSDRAMLRRVGEKAMTELYVSWEDSILRARGLYEEVLENKRAGVYSRTIRDSYDLAREKGREWLREIGELFSEW